MNKANKTSISFCAIILIICGIKWSIGLENHVDIFFGDEAEYLKNGLDLFGRIAKNWGPTYNLWYKFLSVFNSHPIELYYINYKVGSIAVGVLLFLFLVRYNVLIVVAFLIAFCYLFSEININTWPRVTHFVIILLLIYFIAVKNISSTTIKLILFSCITFIGAFARPELFIIAEISGAISIILSIYDYKTIKSKIPFLILLVSIAFVLFFVYGKPADSYLNINRTYIAFCQHYAIAYNMRTHSNSTNAVIEWIDFTRPIFGDCTTVPQILSKHFSLVIPHVLFSTKTYLLSFLMFLLNFVFPIYLIKSVKKKLLLVAIMLVFIATSFIYKKTRTAILNKIKANKTTLLLAFVVSIPSIGMCMIIFPRQHYIMMQMIWVSLLLGLILTAVFEKIKIQTLPIIILTIIFLLISPRATKFNTFQAMPDIKNLCSQKFITYVNKQNWQDKHTIFSNILNIHFLFDKREKFNQFNTEYMLQRMPKDVRFEDILKDYKIDIIFMNDAIKTESRLKNDTTWINLTANPEKYNFKKVVFSNDCGSYLLIKK